jgi:hypothetical protein
MVITYKDLGLINFPIYGLPSDDLNVEDGLLLLDHLVVDDRNQIGDTLGKRRLQSPHKLHRLSAMFEDIGSMLQSKFRIFVDNKGYCFIYEKTKYSVVKYHKILEVKDKETYTALKVSKLNFPIIVKRPPPVTMEWIGLLYFENKPWLPYEYSEVNCKAVRRKI